MVYPAHLDGGFWMEDFEWILCGSDKVQFRKRQYHLRVVDLPCSFQAVRSVRAWNMSQTCELLWFCHFDVASDEMVFKREHLWFPVPPQYIIQIVPFCPESVLFLPAECHICNIHVWRLIRCIIIFNTVFPWHSNLWQDIYVL